MLADSAKMEIDKAYLTIDRAEIKFAEEMERSGKRQERADAGLQNPAGFARGGTVYANNGIFVPRGTDTVPAMLTPGEFVVNRAAVQRGNNLQLLRAMNGSGSTVNAGAAGSAAMSSGGSVRYYQMGDMVKSLGGVFSESLPNLKAIFDGFSTAVTSLANLQLDVTVSKPIDVNITLLNDNILKVIDEKIMNATLDAVAAEIPKYKNNETGQTAKSESLMPK